MSFMPCRRCEHNEFEQKTQTLGARDATMTRLLRKCLTIALKKTPRTLKTENREQGRFSALSSGSFCFFVAFSFLLFPFLPLTQSGFFFSFVSSAASSPALRTSDWDGGGYGYGYRLPATEW